MKTITEGLVLMSKDVGDRDTTVTLLTREEGVIQCFVKGAQSPKTKNFSATQMLTYSQFDIWHGKSSSNVDDAKEICSFFEIQSDIEKLAIAQYFCQMLAQVVPEGVEAPDQLDLMLNCLHTLSTGTVPPALVKAVFEIRLAVISGMMPDLVYCAGCGAYEADGMFFDCSRNTLLCADCCQHREGFVYLSRGALTAFRYVVLSDPKKVFSFTISDESGRMLEDCAERYALSVFECYPKTLEYYHQIKTIL